MPRGRTTVGHRVAMLDGMTSTETMSAMPGGRASLVVAAGDGARC